MSLTMQEKKSVSREYGQHYRNVSKKLKSKLLDGFVDLTGYRRDYASFILRNWGRNVQFSSRVVVVGDGLKRRCYSGRAQRYNKEVVKALTIFWELLNNPCGKRLKPQLSELIEKGIKFGEVLLSEELREKLETISAATIDRILKVERKKNELKCRGKTKPGSLLKRDIPIRTGIEWDENEVGYIEIDLVSHDGGNLRGDFCQTLTAVDVRSGWTDLAAVKNRAQVWVFEALMEMRQRLPFDLKGIDCDNGSEFINNHLYKYCKAERIKFTRSRPCRKNDNCHVEEKNFTAVRNYVGYSRYDTDEQRNVLNELYSVLRLYLNYFQPLMKLEMKKRIGSKIVKKYDKPRTPYQRIIEMSNIDEAIKREMRKIYQGLNPFELKRKIDRLQDELCMVTYIRKRRVS